MKINLKVHSNSSQEKVKKLEDKNYEIWIKEKPIDGKANVFVEKFLKKELGFKCKIVSGFSSKLKVVEIEN
jgi:uncharacterized protein YggU (UPF0235/DUF167 family)